MKRLLLPLLLLLLLLLGLLWSQDAFAQIAVDGATAVIAENSGTSLTFPVTVTSNTNGLLTTCFSWDDGAVSISSVTYNGSAMTAQVSHKETTFNANTLAIYSIKPADGEVTGTHNIVITLSGAAGIGAGSVSFTGVDQTTPVDNPASNDGISTGPTSVVVTSASGKLAAGCSWNGSSVGAPASQDTAQYEATYSLGQKALGQATAPGAASVTLDWTLPGFALWNTVGVNLNAATSSVVPSGLLLRGVGN